MRNPPIAVNIHDITPATREGLRWAADAQFGMIELNGTGELSPQELSQSGRRHLRAFMRGLGLAPASMVADFPQLRLTDPRAVEERIERTRQAIELARDAGIPVVTSAVGALTHPERPEPSSGAVDALRELAAHADRCGVTFSIRPTQDSGERVRAVLDAAGASTLRIDLDPAEQVMSGANPLAMIMRCPGEIAVIHARDGTLGSRDRSGRETVLGSGDVDFATLADVLRELDYNGPLVLRRTDSPNAVADILAGRDQLLRFFRR